MKKFLVIEDEKKLIKIVGDYFIAFMPNLFGDVVPKAYAELQGLVVEEFFKSELQDVMEFEAMVINRPSMVHPTMPDKAIIIPPNLKFGDKLRVFVVKQKGKTP